METSIESSDLFFIAAESSQKGPYNLLILLKNNLSW